MGDPVKILRAENDVIKLDIFRINKIIATEKFYSPEVGDIFTEILYIRERTKRIEENIVKLLNKRYKKQLFIQYDPIGEKLIEKNFYLILESIAYGTDKDILQSLKSEGKKFIKLIENWVASNEEFLNQIPWERMETDLIKHIEYYQIAL